MEYFHGDEHVTGSGDSGNATTQRYSLAAPPLTNHVAEGASGSPRGAFENPVDVRTAARFLGVSASLVYAYVERKQIPHFRMMGRTIRFRLSELARWRQQFHVDGGIDE
jgi:excisionase family DNA binding protein